MHFKLDKQKKSSSLCNGSESEFDGLDGGHKANTPEVIGEIPSSDDMVYYLKGNLDQQCHKCSQ